MMFLASAGCSSRYSRRPSDTILSTPLTSLLPSFALVCPSNLWFPHFDADDSRQSFFADIVTRQIILIILDEPGLAAIVIDRTCQARTESRKMGPAFFRKDIVDKAQDIFAVPIVVSARLHQTMTYSFPVNLNYRRIDSRAVFIQEFYERHESAFITVYFLLAFASFIRQGNMQSLIEERQLHADVF